MLESFSAVTELLRHFYAVMGRRGAAAPTPGNPSAQKAEAIFLRLSGDETKKLESKKRKLAETTASHGFDAQSKRTNGG